MYKYIKTIAVFSLYLISSYSIAQEVEESYACGFYQDPLGEIAFTPCWSIGLGAGQSFLSPEDEGSSWSLDQDQDSAWRIALSYRAWAYTFFEIVYADLGEASFNNSNTAITEPASIAYSAPALFVGAEYPIWLKKNRVLSAHLKLGASSIDSSSDSELLQVDQESDVQLAWGAGVRYQFADHWAASADFESFSEDSSLASMSIHYLFGGKQRRTYQPKVDELVEEPNPVSEPQIQDKDGDGIDDVIDACHTAAEYINKVDESGCVRYNHDFVPLMFAHNETHVTSFSDRNEVILRHYVSVLKRYPDTKVLIVGHADGFGTTENNHEVSKKRALSVFEYLQRAGIAEQRMIVKAEGDTLPSTSSDARGVNSQGLSQRHDRRVELIVLPQE